MTPSSAATTSTAISVTLAPRARISVNASWPGVSTNEISLAVLLDRIRANVLRDAAAFAAHHVDADDPIEQRRLAVVDVAQERDDRRTLDQICRIFFLRLELREHLIFAGSPLA